MKGVRGFFFGFEKLAVKFCVYFGFEYIVEILGLG